MVRDAVCFGGVRLLLGGVLRGGGNVCELQTVKINLACGRDAMVRGGGLRARFRQLSGGRNGTHHLVAIG